MKEIILEILESYGKSVDPQGREIGERFDALEKLMKLFTNQQD